MQGDLLAGLDGKETKPYLTDTLASLLHEASWQAKLKNELQKPYIAQLESFLNQEALAGKDIFPPSQQVFNALNTTSFDSARVVIIGQDPYHGANQAHGLSFSVPATQKKIPPSLQNIYKELQSDLGMSAPVSGDLSHWAQQGVLLLNATFTVEKANAGSHQKQGWEVFSDAVIEQLNQHRQGLVFVLWGSFAQKKGAMIDESRHKIIKSAHPSPLSAYRGFFGSKPFSAINQHLSEQSLPLISW